MSKHSPSPKSEVVYVDEFHVDEHRPAPLAIIYRSEFDYISRCILDYPDIETGGQLFGFWTGTGIPVVLYAIGPGRDANHQVAFFNQDVDYLKRVGQQLIDTYALQHIGEWHSHHQLGLAHPSGHDASTMINSIRDVGLRRFLLCIGNCTRSASTLNAFNFHEEDLRNYVQAAWIINEMESPFRPLVDRQLASMLEHPYTRVARHGDNYIAVNRPAHSAPAYSRDYWLRDKSNNLQLKKIVDFLISFIGGSPSVQLDDSGRVTVSMPLPWSESEVFEAYFPDAFPDEAPEIYVPEALCATPVALPDNLKASAPLARDVWPAEGEIADRFITCVRRLCGQLPPPIDDDVLNEDAGAVNAETIVKMSVSVDTVKKHLMPVCDKD